MAVGLTSKIPVQAKLKELEGRFPQYHIVVWDSSAGSCFKLLPGARWIQQWSVKTHAGGNFLSRLRNGTHRYECCVMIDGAFEYNHKMMSEENFSYYVACTAEFDFVTKQCIMESRPQFSASRWMSYLDDDLSLKDLSLPGTRYSSASSSWINESGNLEIEPELQDQHLKKRILDMQKCHKGSIFSQLTSGVRLLDLRCDATRALRHGPLTFDKQLDYAIDEIKKFLKENNEETVLVVLSFSSATAAFDAAKPWSEGYSVKNDNVPEHFNREIKRDMQNDKDLYTETVWPTLGEARGKIVIFRGWDLDPDQDQWALDCRLPVWEASDGSPASTKATELANTRWNEIVGDFSSQNSLKSIILAAALPHDPKYDTTWIPPLQTAPILQKKAEEHMRQCTKQLKRLWIYGDGMDERTNMAIAKLNFWGSDDEGVGRPPTAKFETL